MSKIRTFVAKIIMVPFMVCLTVTALIGFLSFILASLIIPAENFEKIIKRLETLINIPSKTSSTTSSSTTLK